LIGALVSVLGTASAARAGVPTAFTTVSGTCSHGVDNFVTPAVTGNHQDPLARISTQAGPGELKVNDEFLAGDWGLFGGADTLWMRYSGTLPSGESVRGQVECDQGATVVPYSLDFFDLPTTPTSFAGASTPPPNHAGGGSEFAFRTPAAAHYVADFQGACAAPAFGYVGDRPITPR
jgi:hypothetical protein